jgi:hypothetical protein
MALGGGGEGGGGEEGGRGAAPVLLDLCKVKAVLATNALKSCALLTLLFWGFAVDLSEAFKGKQAVWEVPTSPSVGVEEDLQLL